jgi:hypothetical protein
MTRNSSTSASSSALAKWASERCAALDSLEEVHGKVTGRQPGRPRATVHLNRALFVALSAEVQGSAGIFTRTPPFTSRRAFTWTHSNAKIAPFVLNALASILHGGCGYPWRGSGSRVGPIFLDMACLIRPVSPGGAGFPSASGSFVVGRAW